MPECYNKLHIYKNLDRQKFPNGILVGCGSCINCKKNRAQEKALRFLHEKEMNKDAKLLYLTWTLDDKRMDKENCIGKRIGKDGKEESITTLRKDKIRKIRDKIYSRLYRRSLKKFGKKAKHLYYTKCYKYIIAGEYGENGTDRAHYHIVILTTKHHSLIKKLWMEEWDEGRVDIQSDATIKSIFYVAGYVAKKLGYSKEIEDEREQPFLMMSRGLGLDWAIAHSEELKQREYCYRPTRSGAVKTAIPRYYIQKLEELGYWTEDEVEEYNRKRREEIKKKDAEIIEKVNIYHKMIRGADKNIWNDIDIAVKTKEALYDKNGNRVNEYVNMYTKKEGIWINTYYENLIYLRNQKKKREAEFWLKQKMTKRGKKYGKYNKFGSKIS